MTSQELTQAREKLRLSVKDVLVRDPAIKNPAFMADRIMEAVIIDHNTGRPVGLPETAQRVKERWLDPPAAATPEVPPSVAPRTKYSAEQIFGRASDSKLANALSMSDIKEYHRLKIEARAKGLIA